MRTRMGMVLVAACAALGLAAGCGGDDDEGKGKGSKGASVLELSTAARKLTAVSADTHGVRGRARGRIEGGGAQSLKPGETLELPTLPKSIVDGVKQQVGIDVRVECPPSVTFSPGAVFYCKLYTSDGTGFDVKCTQLPDGQVAWEVDLSRPTPPQPPGPTPRMLEGKRGKATPPGGPPSKIEEGDELDLSYLDDEIESTMEQQTGLDLNVECPASVAYSPGSTFYCKLYDPNWVAYDVLCTQDQFGSVTWQMVDPIYPPAGKRVRSRLSSAARKLTAASAKEHGLEGRARSEGGGASTLQPGEAFDVSFVADAILQYVKRRTGLDAKVDCPRTVQYAPGAVFSCRLTLPDGTSWDVRCTQLEGGAIRWEILMSQPVLRPPDGGETPNLKDATGSTKRFEAGDRRGPPKPGERVDISDFDEFIEREIKAAGGPDVNVECPDSIVYSPGSTFYCKLFLPNGTVYDIKCTQHERGIDWDIIFDKPRS